MTPPNGHFRPKSRTEQIVEAQHGAPLEALLRRLYVTEGLSQDKVAATLGISQRSVIRWMAAYGIPTRDRRKVAA
jgi:predicted DNA-binding protein (UPF0251 family)